MLKFKKFELLDIPCIKAYYMRCESRACDNTIGAALMWRDYFQSEFALLDDTMISKVKYFEVEAFTMPVGENVEGALRAIEEYCKAANMPMIIVMAVEEDVERLKKLYNCEAHGERDWSDYLYNVADLAQLVGKRYNGQRNHINFFLKNFNYKFEKLTAENLPQVVDFYNSYVVSAKKNYEMYDEDRRKITEMFDNFDLYMQEGVVLYVDDAVVAFAIGERRCDTLYVHVEKARYDVRGAHQMIMREFARIHENNVLYVNREDDAGDEGLRRAKLANHPCKLIDKHTVNINL